MKRSIGTSSASPGSSRARQRQDVPELPSEMWDIIFFHLQYCDKNELKHASVVSKLCRDSVFKSVKLVELSESPVDGMFDGGPVGLGRLSVSLLPRFSGANALRVSWAPTYETFKGYLSALPNLTFLRVETCTGLLPSSVPYPSNLIELVVTGKAHPSWRSMCDAKNENESAEEREEKEKEDLSRFANLRKLKFDNADRVDMSRSSITENTSREFGRKIVSDPILPNLRFLEFANSSAIVLDRSNLCLSKLKTLVVSGEYCDFQRVRCIKDLVSLVHLDVSQRMWTSFGRSLNALTNLRTLRLRNWKISGREVSRLFHLVKLRLEGRCYSNFFDDLEPGSLTGLKELSLSCTEKADVSKLTGLTDLQLYDCRVDAESVARLPHLASLKLSYDHHGIDDRNIGSLTNLRSLIVRHSTVITGEGIFQLADLVSLTTTNVKGANYEFLTKMPNLTQLDVRMPGRV